MRKAIAVATVAGLILGAASVSAVSAQDWSIGFEGFFSNNLGGGFKGGVSSPVADTMLVVTMPKYVKVIKTVWDTYDTMFVKVNGDTAYVNEKVSRVDSTERLVGRIDTSKVVVKRNMPDTKEMFTPHYSGGAGVFFASKYAEASVGLAYLGGTWKRTVVGKNSVEPIYNITRIVRDSVKITAAEGSGADGSFSITHDSTRAIRNDTTRTTTVSMDSQWEREVKAFNVNIGAWLKYPYELSDAVKLFPIAGIEYEICTIITTEMRSLTDANSWSRTWFKAGVGGDFYLSERVYLHPIVLYGIGWKNSVERGIMKEAGVSGETKISHGLTAKVGIGYTFNLD